jgi:hypothetical protein
MTHETTHSPDADPALLSSVALWLAPALDSGGARLKVLEAALRPLNTAASALTGIQPVTLAADGPLIAVCSMSGIVAGHLPARESALLTPLLCDGLQIHAELQKRAGDCILTVWLEGS